MLKNSVFFKMSLGLASWAKKMGCNQASKPATKYSRKECGRRAKRNTTNSASDNSSEGGAQINRDQLPGFAHGLIISLSDAPNDLPVSQFGRACFSLDATGCVGLILGAARLAS